MTAPSRQLANLRDHLPDLLMNMAKSPEIWILAGSLGAGIIGGILFRRKGPLGSSPSAMARQVKRAASNAQDRLQDAQNRLTDQANETATNAGRTAQHTARGTRKAAKRAARRGRWFRRGLLVGSTGAMLFAPRPGDETRAQLKTRLEQWRTRIA